MISSILLTSDSLEDLSVSNELNERLLSSLESAIVVFDSNGKCMKVNRDACDLFFLESSSQWIGRHAEDLLIQTNPKLLSMWSAMQDTRTEQSRRVNVYPYQGEADGDMRGVRCLPCVCDAPVTNQGQGWAKKKDQPVQKALLGSVVILCPLPGEALHGSASQSGGKRMSKTDEE